MGGSWQIGQRAKFAGIGGRRHSWTGRLAWSALTCRRVLEEYSPLIWSVVASYVRNPEERDDVYQDICVRIWERRAQYAGRGSLAGWINRIAHRWCYNWRHGHRRRESSKQRLRESLARLPRKQSDTFVLVRLKGYSIAEAAGALKVRPATVRSNLGYANRKLRKLLKEFEHGLS